jgi:HEAT repeat protein
MISRRVFSCFIFVTCFAVGNSSAKAAQPDAGPGQPQLYQSAVKALDDSSWEEAARLFSQAAHAPGDQQDGALYWCAYAQNKLGHRGAAIGTLDDLESRFPKSRWLKDARGLRVAISPASAISANAQEDDDLKLIAINSLMASDSDRAIALLVTLLQRSSSSKLQEQALFVLAQNKSPQAREIIGDIARGKGHPELQPKAIEYLGMLGGSESRQILADLYPTAGSPVKKKILRSFMLSGERNKILAAAKSETEADVRATAIQQLGVMGAKRELFDLYSSQTEIESKKEIIRALSLSNDAEHLLPIAQNEKDPALRLEAVRTLGLLPASETGPALLTLYRAEKSLEPRRGAIDALSLQNNAPALMEIAQSEKDPQLRKAAVSKLSLIRSKEAQEYMIKLLEK